MKSERRKPKSVTKSKQEPRLSRTRMPDDLSLVEWQRGLRRQFGREQALELEGEAVASAEEVTNVVAAEEAVSMGDVNQAAAVDTGDALRPRGLARSKNRRAIPTPIRGRPWCRSASSWLLSSLWRLPAIPAPQRPWIERDIATAGCKTSRCRCRRRCRKRQGDWPTCNPPSPTACAAGARDQTGRSTLREGMKPRMEAPHRDDAEPDEQGGERGLHQHECRCGEAGREWPQHGTLHEGLCLARRSTALR